MKKIVVGFVLLLLSATWAAAQSPGPPPGCFCWQQQSPCPCEKCPCGPCEKGAPGKAGWRLQIGVGPYPPPVYYHAPPPRFYLGFWYRPRHR
jgi:hypothetical protein